MLVLTPVQLLLHVSEVQVFFVVSPGTSPISSLCNALAVGGSVLYLKPAIKWTTATMPSKESVCPTGSSSQRLQHTRP